MKSSRSVFVVAPLLPWPPHDGGRIGIAFRIRELARHGVRVRLFATQLPTEPRQRGALEEWCEEVITVQRPARGSQLFRQPFQPYGFTTRYLPELRACLRDRITRHPPDVVHLEQTQMGEYWRDVPPEIPVLLGVHNLEFRGLLAQARSLGIRPKAIAYWVEGVRLRAAERRLFSRARLDGLVFVSCEERAWVERAFPKLAGRCLHLPPGCDLWEHAGDLASRPMNLAFVGGLWFQPNVQGLLWFLRNVWPAVLRSVPAATLTVAGRGASADLENSLRETVGVRYVGQVEEVRHAYDGARGVVLPIRHGAGVKVKTVEAVGTGVPCVGTMHAFGGLNLENHRCCLMADEPAEFAALCIDVLMDPDMGRELGNRARAFAEANLTWTAIGRRYVTVIDALVGGVPIGADPSLRQPPRLTPL